MAAVSTAVARTPVARTPTAALAGQRRSVAARALPQTSTRGGPVELASAVDLKRRASQFECLTVRPGVSDVELPRKLELLA